MKIPPISAYRETLGMIFFARMLDKIRLQANGNLREDFQPNLGIATGADGACVKYLGVSYADVKTRVLEGGPDEDILRWCYAKGHEPGPLDVLIWNEFLRKLGWNDFLSATLARVKKESGLEHRTDIQTMAEYFEVDEGRKS